MRKIYVLEKETLLRDGWTGGQTDIKGSVKDPRGPKNKRINIRKKTGLGPRFATSRNIG